VTGTETETETGTETGTGTEPGLMAFSPDESPEVLVEGKAVALPLPEPDGEAWQSGGGPSPEVARRWGAYTALGVAAATAAAAVVFGALALWTRSEVDGAVLREDTARERRRIAETLETAELHARTADLLGIGALVAAGTGLWLWPGALSGTE